MIASIVYRPEVTSRGIIVVWRAAPGQPETALRARPQSMEEAESAIADAMRADEAACTRLGLRFERLRGSIRGIAVLGAR